MEEKLITLEEHDLRMREMSKKLGRDKPNGIACPKCGKELLDVYGIILTSNPPKKQTYCSNEECDYKGNRVS